MRAADERRRAARRSGKAESRRLYFSHLGGEVFSAPPPTPAASG
jgi:hypothetical protein